MGPNGWRLVSLNARDEGEQGLDVLDCCYLSSHIWSCIWKREAETFMGYKFALGIA